MLLPVMEGLEENRNYIGLTVPWKISLKQKGFEDRREKSVNIGAEQKTSFFTKYFLEKSLPYSF